MQSLMKRRGYGGHNSYLEYIMYILMYTIYVYNVQYVQCTISLSYMEWEGKRGGGKITDFQKSLCWGGAKAYDGEKAWYSINHPILSG
jgi:hypothetical protein